MIIKNFDYNSIVILSYFFLSLSACFLNFLTKGKSNKLLFSNYRSSFFSPLTYIRLFTHSLGHSNFDHFVHNFLYILLLGPLMEEKYGSINLLFMFLITSLVVSLFNIIFSNYSIKGASANVYMLIVLSSFTNISNNKIPLTFILICLFYVVSEVKNSLSKKNKNDHTYYAGHILGAICGAVFGFYFK